MLRKTAGSRWDAHRREAASMRPQRNAAENGASKLVCPFLYLGFNEAAA